VARNGHAGAGRGAVPGHDPLGQIIDSRELAQATIDALASELAILDEAGRIIMVNRAWQEFGARNDPMGRDFVGASYLAACESVGIDDGESAGAHAFADALRQLIDGRRERFEVEYPCHSPTEERWFVARAARFSSNGHSRVVVTHEDVTARRHSEDRHRHIAETLQASLLPPELPAAAGLDIGARYRPQGEGLEVGGDFYDVFPDGDAWVAVIGDVCGKGATAAAVTAEARWTIRALAPTTSSPARLLHAVNRSLTGRRRDSTFLSALVVRVEADSDGAHAVCARAGHPPPLVVRAGGGVEGVDAHGGLLGLFPDERFWERPVRLGRGDSLVLVTDGVTEARRGTDEMGGDGLRAVLAGAPPGLGADALGARVEQAALRAAGGRLRDDIAILVIRATGLPGTA
jgi:hypothetical protein